MEIAKEYKEFLDQGKTERECVTRAVKMAKEKGYKNLTDFIENKTPIKAPNPIPSINIPQRNPFACGCTG